MLLSFENERNRKSTYHKMFISTEDWNWDVWKREDHENDAQEDHSTVPHCEDEDFNESYKTKC